MHKSPFRWKPMSIKYAAKEAERWNDGQFWMLKIREIRLETKTELTFNTRAAYVSQNL